MPDHSIVLMPGGRAVPIHRYVVSHGAADTTFNNGYILADSYSLTLSAFEALYREAARDFPQLRPDLVGCRRVEKSSWCRGWACLSFSLGHGALVIPEGWHHVERLPDIMFP